MSFLFDMAELKIRRPWLEIDKESATKSLSCARKLAMKAQNGLGRPSGRSIPYFEKNVGAVRIK